MGGKYRDIKGKGNEEYFCPKCKKWKPYHAVPTEEWNKLPAEWQNTTICRDCFFKITKTKYLKHDMLLGKTNLNFEEKIKRML